MDLFDSHAHLGATEFYEDLPLVIQRAKDVGVKKIANCSDSYEDFARVVQLKQDYPDICLCCLGLHPEVAARGLDYINKSLKFMEQHVDLMNAVGECGLDYSREENGTRFQQITLFRKMCQFAVKHELPLIVHCREAGDDVLAVLAETGVNRVDMHCYAGDLDLAEKLMSLGIDIRFSFNGILTFKKGDDVREVAAHLPLGLMMLETDSPCLAPVPKRGKRNEPSYLPIILDALVKVRGEDKDYLSKVIFDSTMNFYGLDR